MSEGDERRNGHIDHVVGRAGRAERRRPRVAPAGDVRERAVDESAGDQQAVARAPMRRQVGGVRERDAGRVRIGKRAALAAD